MGNTFKSPTHCIDCNQYVGNHGSVSMLCDDCTINNRKVKCEKCGFERFANKECYICKAALKGSSDVSIPDGFPTSIDTKCKDCGQQYFAGKESPMCPSCHTICLKCKDDLGKLGDVPIVCRKCYLKDLGVTCPTCGNLCVDGICSKCKN